MDVDFAFLCDAAQESGGKLHALGIGLDGIITPTVPATHALLTVAAQLRYSVAEAGAKALAVRVVDADGRSVVPPIDQQLVLPEPQGAPTSAVRILLQLGGVTFQAYGLYSIHVAVGGHEVARLPLNVLPAAPGSSPGV